MRIETKFDIGERVYFKIPGGYCGAEVDRITIRVICSGGGSVIRYHTTFDGGKETMRLENTLFGTLRICEDAYDSEE